MLSFERRIFVPEAIDSLEADDERMRRTYAHLAMINRLLSRMRGLLRRIVLDHATQEGRPATVLEVGCGGGDVLAWLARVRDRRGLHLTLRGLDADPRAVARARARLAGLPDVSVQLGTLAEQSGDAAPADYVFCNHVLHHAAPEEVVPFLRTLRASARRTLLVNDLERSPLAYLLYTMLAGLAFHRSYVFADGRLSIRKGFRVPELESACAAAGFPPEARVERHSPWRVVIVAPGAAPERAVRG